MDIFPAIDLYQKIMRWMCWQFSNRRAGCSEEALNKLSGVLVFHGRLEYAELLELYQNMDYLFLAREKNIITESNFPSKVPEMLVYGVIPVCSDVGDYTKLYLRTGENAISVSTGFTLRIIPHWGWFA